MEKKPTIHSMNRRSLTHDYSRPGRYHITLHVARKQWQPLGAVEGSLSMPDGHPQAPHVVLSNIGTMVEHELMHSIAAHYPMSTVEDSVVMPEHVHFILHVTAPLVSRNGTPTHLGMLIAGFKKGCNRRYWEMTGMTASSGETAAPSTAPGGSPAGTAPASPAGTAPGGSPAGTAPASPAGNKVPSSATTGRPPLFDYGYCDVMPIDTQQAEIQRQYILNNPRSRLLRTTHRAWLQPQRGGIDTALTPSALQGYLIRECAGFTPETFASIQCRLLLAGGKIACDSYGNRALLTEHRLLPVVCHRKYQCYLQQQKERCLEEAAKGAVLVSPRIANGEQTIIDEAVHHGFPVVLIADNGFPAVYHPSEERIDGCASGCLLMVTPWQYQYRKKDDPITVPFCKTMNCVAQALCRLKDSWWQT